VLSRISIVAAIPAVLAAAVPQSFSLRVPDLNPNDSGRLLAADSSGNLFVVSASTKTSAIVNIHVVKTDPAGNVIAAFDFGGSGVDTPSAAAVDPQGNLIVAGSTYSTDFPLVSPLRTTGIGFATKIDAQLGKILFSTLLGTVGGGPVTAGASAVAVDATGNIYLTGSTGDGFPTTTGVLQPQAPALGQAGTISHGFVTELSAAGDSVVFATYFSGGSFTCSNNNGSPCLIFLPPTNESPPVIATTPTAIAVDSTGAVIVGGTTNSTGIPVSADAYATQCGCTNLEAVAFIAKLAPGGAQLEWGTYLPPVANAVPLYADSIVGVPMDTISSLALDAAGNVVFAGTAALGFPISAGALQSTFPSASGESYAGYIARLDSTGSKLLFSTWLGGATSVDASTGPAGLAIDSAGIVWVTGGAGLATLPAPAGTPLLGEEYIAGLSADGSSVLSLFTVPDGGAGAAIQITQSGALDVLGASGALLISGPSAPSLLGLAGAPSYTVSNAVAPRELVSLYGMGLGPSTGQNASITNGIIPNSVSGVQVLFDGVPAALLYAGPTQINAIVPTETVARETTTISIVTPTGTITGPTFAVVPTLPEVFANIEGYAAAVNQDGTLNSYNNLAQPNSIVSIWLTGGGAQSYTPDNTVNTSLRGNPYPVSILASNPQVPFPELTSLEVLYAGDAPGQPSGVIQVNFLLPKWFTGNSYQVQIGAATETFSIWAQ
jgi:uncharacterized protein (TIGR03437 family)